MGGGSGGGTTTQVVQKADIPEYEQQFSRENQDVARDIASRPFPIYGGQRIAETNPLTNSAADIQKQLAANFPGMNTQFQSIIDALGKRVGSEYGQPGAAQQASAGSFGGQVTAGSYGQPVPQPGAAGSYGGVLPGVQYATANSFGQMVPGAQSYGQQLDPGDIAPWMSPFVEQALAPQLRAVQRQGAASGRQIQGNAVGAGAFGDARTGIEMGENTRNTNTLMSDVVGQGYQSAYDRAVSAAQNAFGQNVGQFNTEQKAMLDRWAAGAGQFNTEESARRAVAQQNNQAALAQYGVGAGQFNTEEGARRAVADQALRSWQAGAGQFNTEDAAQRAATTQNMAQFNAEDAARRAAVAQNNASNLDVYKSGATQFNANLANQINLASGMRDTINAENNYGNNLAQQLYTGGQTMQAQAQRPLDLAYQDFINQFQYPQEMLNLRLATLSGSPYATTRLQTTNQAASPLGQGLGTLAALYGLFGRGTPAGV